MAANEAGGKDTLVVVWTSGDREVARSMVFRYTRNAKLRGWWKNVRLVVWGPSAPLLAGDAEMQEGLEELKHVGVELLACKACSDMYGVSEKLEALGVQVIFMGPPLTEYLKAGLPVLTV